MEGIKDIDRGQESVLSFVNTQTEDILRQRTDKKFSFHFWTKDWIISDHFYDEKLEICSVTFAICRQ